MDHGAEYYRRFLSGDDGALTQLVGTYKDGLLFFLNRYVNDLSAAEELTEDTFFRLITKKPAFSGRSSFQSWLYAIGRHTAIDYLRRVSRSAPVPASAQAGGVPDPEEAYLRDERKILVHRALSALPDDYRRVLHLVYFEGFSSQEAAVALRKNSRQIRNLLYRARQALKTELEKEGFPYEDL